MDFEKICMIFTMQEPYYGILLSSMKRIPDKNFETLGVGRSGNVFQLRYNPDFVNKFNVDTIIELLRHEVLHVAFNHFSIWNGEDDNDTDDIHRLRNIAADLEINCYLNRNKMDPASGGVWVEDLGFNKFEGTREYFKQLIQKAQQPQSKQAKQPDKPCNGGLGGQAEETDPSNGSQSPTPQQNNTPQNEEGGNGTENSSSTPNSGSSQYQPQNISKDFVDSLNPFDNHSDWPDLEDGETKEQLQQVIDDMLVFAAEEVEKARGTLPGELVGRIKLLREKKRPKPVADWKRYFRRYLGNEFSEFIRKSKKRESRRFPDAAGNRHRRKSHILVAIDTSGSVSMPEYREFFGQIKTLTATADFHVVECDAVIQHEYDYKGKPNEMLHGGGGTNFQPVVDLFNKDKRKYDALVYFTDGECSIPRDTPKDTLWVISSKGDQSSRSKYKVNGASVAFIPKHQ